MGKESCPTKCIRVFPPLPWIGQDGSPYPLVRIGKWENFGIYITSTGTGGGAGISDLFGRLNVCISRGA